MGRAIYTLEVDRTHNGRPPVRITLEVLEGVGCINLVVETWRHDGPKQQIVTELSGSDAETLSRMCMATCLPLGLERA